MNNNPIICAIDSADLKYSYNLTLRLKDKVRAIKLGLEFFTACGIDGVNKISEIGTPIFLDLKLHDIPNTVRKVCSILKNLNIFMLTLHASGGREMMQAAIAELAQTNTEVIGVTLLTSLANQDIKGLKTTSTISDQALQLAQLAQECGLTGVVCSGYEAQEIRMKCGDDFTIVTPGIRPNRIQVHDHKRSITPSDALTLGANYLVIGRPITESNNPEQTIEKILQDIHD